MKLYLTDIDNTILPLDKKTSIAQEDLDNWYKRVKSHNVKFGYISGRSYKLVMDILEELPKPDFFVSDVGTQIYFKKGKKWQKDEDYRKFIAQSWHGKTRKNIKKALLKVNEIKEQEKRALSEFKQSYYLDFKYNSQKVIQKIKTILKKENLESQVIYSVGPEKEIGLIDILPKRAGKRGAITFLMNKFDLNIKDVIYSGDSGNDLDALTMNCFSILVGNARKEIKKQAKAQIKDKNKLYIAKKSYIKGVLEGFDHFGFFK